MAIYAYQVFELATTRQASTSNAMLSLVEDIAVQYAVVEMAKYISRKIGGSFGDIVAVAATIVAMSEFGMIQGEGSIYWLNTADKALNIENTLLSQKAEHLATEYAKYMSDLQEKTAAYSLVSNKPFSLLDPAEKLELMNSERLSTGLMPIMLEVEELNKLDTLSNEINIEAVPVDYNQADTLYNNSMINDSLYDFESKMFDQGLRGDYSYLIKGCDDEY
jgi:hypothetical protein